MGALGRNWAARFAARFKGRLSAATFTKETITGPDPANVSGPPLSSSATYACDAYAFDFEERFVDGETIRKGDYKVMILRGTIEDSAGDPAAVLPAVGDVVSCPPPGSETPLDARVVSVSPITEAFVTCHVRGGPP